MSFGYHQKPKLMEGYHSTVMLHAAGAEGKGVELSFLLESNSRHENVKTPQRSHWCSPFHVIVEWPISKYK